MVQYGRPSCSSWKGFIRSSFGRTVVGTAIRENSIRARVGESSSTKVAQMLVKQWRPFDSSWMKSVWSSICQMIAGKTIWKKFWWDWDGEKLPIWECLFVLENKVYSCRDTWMSSKWREESGNWVPCGSNWWNWSILDNQHHFLGCTQRECKSNESFLRGNRNIFESRISARPTEKLLGWEKHHAETIAWSYDMEVHAKKVRGKSNKWQNKKAEQLYKVSSPCITRVTTDSVAMWVARHGIFHWACSKTQTLLETLKIRNRTRENSVYLRKSNIRSC